MFPTRQINLLPHPPYFFLSSKSTFQEVKFAAKNGPEHHRISLPSLNLCCELSFCHIIMILVPIETTDTKFVDSDVKLFI